MVTNPASSQPQGIAGQPERSIVLVGMMGVGKSTVGRKLALKLGVPFVDADHEIETAAQLSISEIFARMGEEAFRDGERRVIARLLDGPPQVIATGGGAFVCNETRALVLERALSIWLHAELDVLVERVGRRSNRPLLKNRDPHEVLSALAAVRDPLYAQADIHIRSDRGPHDSTVARILERLGQA